MCGVAGLLHSDRARIVAQDDLLPLREALRHRGPDDSGVFTDGPCGLVHTRLSILDLSERARQPMLSPTRRFAVSFNGEIYNYREIRSRLQARGRTFATTSDTEVILHLMEEGGVDALRALEGMFAFALFDRERRELWLIRDRLGIKPMFWAKRNGLLAFGSEPKALRHLAAVARPSAARIGEYVAFRHLAESEAFEPGVETLLPGQRLWTDGKELRIESWWRPGHGRDADPDAVDEVIGRSVRRQLVSDVPVGTFLSGGIDSALVTAHAAAALPSLDTFTVGFAEEGWDETERARRVASALGAKAHEVKLDERAYVAGLGRAIWHLDAPLNHAHSPHLMELARFARQHITVALTGEGSDELFAGYPRYRLFRAGRMLRGLPEPLRARLAQGLRSRAPRWARLLDAAVRDCAPAAACNAAFVPLADAARVAGVARASDLAARRVEIAREAGAEGRDELESLLELDRRTYLVALLQRMDRMTMAVGLEARVPLLDEEMLDFSLRLDSRHKVDARDSKKPVRRAAERRFGRDHAHATKFGFGVPLDAWMRGEGAFASLLRDVLNDRRTRERGWLDVELLQERLRAHRSGAADATELLWGALNLELFARICLEGAGPDRINA